MPKAKKLGASLVELCVGAKDSRPAQSNTSIESATHSMPRVGVADSEWRLLRKSMGGSKLAWSNTSSRGPALLQLNAEEEKSGQHMLRSNGDGPGWLWSKTDESESK